MATQTVEFKSIEGETITAKLYSIGNDTVVDSGSATEETNRTGTYTVEFTNLSAGKYHMVAEDASGTNLGDSYVATKTATGTYYALEDESLLYPQPENYGTDGQEATLSEILHLILAHVGEFELNGVTKTLKKLDGSTTAATCTLDSASTPTSITRTT